MIVLQQSPEKQLARF